MWCSIPHVGTYRLLVCWLPINLLEVWCDGLCCACAAVVVYFPTWFLDLFIEVICILVIYILVIFLFYPAIHRGLSVPYADNLHPREWVHARSSVWYRHMHMLGVIAASGMQYLNKRQGDVLRRIPATDRHLSDTSSSHIRLTQSVERRREVPLRRHAYFYIYILYITITR